MKKIIFFDIDGTLMNNSTYTISKSTINTLKKLKQQHLVCIATGRGYDSMLKTEIDKIINWDGFVCNNGQEIYDANHQILFKSSFEPSTVKAVIETANKLNLAVILKSNPRIITQQPNEYVYTFQKHFNNTIPSVGTYTNQEVLAMVVCGPLNYDYAPFYAIPNLNVMPGVSTYADLSVKGISKQTGIKFLLDYYQMTEYIAFGDSSNDQDMLKGATIAVVMGQAEQSVKDLATFITHDIDHDGIEYACKQLNLI